MRAKFLWPIFLFLVSSSFAQPRKSYELTDINVHLIISIVGLPEPVQMLVKAKSGRTAGFELNSEYSAVKMYPGEEYKLKVELVDEKGVRKNITDSKYLKFNTSKPYAFHVVDRRLILKPEPGTPNDGKNIGSGLGQVRVEFISPSNEIGFNGFAVDLQEKK